MSGTFDSDYTFKQPNSSRDTMGEDAVARYVEYASKAIPAPEPEDFSRSAQSKRVFASLALRHAENNNIDTADPQIQEAVYWVSRKQLKS